MTFSYHDGFQSISNLSQYPKDDPLIKYSDSVKSNFGYTIEKVYLNFMDIPMVVCRRDGVNVLVPPEAVPSGTVIGKNTKCFIILTYHRFGKDMIKEKCYFNRYQHSLIKPSSRATTYAKELDEMKYAVDLFKISAPKDNNVVMLNTVITEDIIDRCEGGFYCFDEDVTIARVDALELHRHPFNMDNTNEVYIDNQVVTTSLEVTLNDTERRFPDTVYYMVGNMPVKLGVQRDCFYPNGLTVVYKDANSKKVTKHHYPIVDIIDGTHSDKLDFQVPILYRSRSDAINYGKGDDILKNIINKTKLDLEHAKTEASKIKFEFEEKAKELDLDKSKFDEEIRRTQQEQKLRQEEFEHKKNMEELRLKQQREEVILKEKQQSEYWKGIIAFATGVVGLLVVVLKK